jgi:hypothetical protein
MSIENRNLSSLMPAWISVLGTGNNKVFAFTLAGSERDAGTPTIKAYRPNRREFAVVRPVFTTLLGGIHHSNRCLPPNSYLRTLNGIHCIEGPPPLSVLHDDYQ